MAGAVAKLADESPAANLLGLNDLGTYLGLWVVLVAVLAAWSRSREVAALSVSSFFFAMILAYYTSTWLLFGVVPVGTALLWAVAALILAPLLSVLIWPARREGWTAAFAAALPIGLLLWEAYSLRLVLPLHLTQFVFDLAAAVALFVVLPHDGAQRLRVLALAPLLMVGAGIGMERILPLLLGFLQ